MNSLTRFARAVLLTACMSSPLFAQSFLEQIDEVLFISSPSGLLRADLSGLVDLETYVPETPALGLINTNDEVFFNPRLALFLDVQAGRALRAHAQMRVDRGFDPGFAPDGQVRLDEYYLDWLPLEDDRLRVRIGKFATAFGTWARRSLSWDNPLITPPALYSDMVPASDRIVAPRAAFQARRGQPDNLNTWVPVIWGPSYCAGLAVSGRLELFDYAFEVKNAALSSRPEAWDAVTNGWDATTFTGRLGWRPAPEWTLGTSFSHGPWLLEETQSALRPGANWRDFDQTTFGLDAAYAHGRWQIWAELATSRFEIPEVGGVRMLSGFVEAKYKCSATWWLAARWNQSWFGDTPGTRTPWDNDGWRADLAVGHRFSHHLQAKLQYSLAGRDGPHEEGEHLLVAQLTLRF